MSRIDCSTCCCSGNGDGPGRQRKACWWDHSSAVRVDNCATPRRGRDCPEIEECDGTEECPDCGGTGLVDLDAEWAEARKILRGSEG